MYFHLVTIGCIDQFPCYLTLSCSNKKINSRPLILILSPYYCLHLHSLTLNNLPIMFTLHPSSSSIHHTPLSFTPHFFTLLIKLKHQVSFSPFIPNYPVSSTLDNFLVWTIFHSPVSSTFQYPKLFSILHSPVDSTL